MENKLIWQLFSETIFHTSEPKTGKYNSQPKIKNTIFYS